MKTFDLNMQQKQWLAPFVEVLANRNTLQVNNNEEFEIAKKLFANVGVQINVNWSDYRKQPGFKGIVCMEWRNWKGFSCYFDPEESKNWYEQDPIQLKDILEA